MSHQGDILPFCGPGTFHALPLSHSPPPNLLYLLKRKTLPILFQPVKTLEPTPWSATGFFVPKINNMEVIFQ